jgi:hypothetical protein
LIGTALDFGCILQQGGPWLRAVDGLHACRLVRQAEVRRPAFWSGCVMLGGGVGPQSLGIHTVFPLWRRDVRLYSTAVADCWEVCFCSSLQASVAT